MLKIDVKSLLIGGVLGYLTLLVRATAAVTKENKQKEKEEA